MGSDRHDERSDREFGQRGNEAAFNVRTAAIIRSAQQSC
jgi:hypothetical protein